MIVGVDASNLNQGGGFTHISNLLAAANPQDHGIDRVVAWGSRATLDRLPERAWLDKQHEPMLDRGLASRILWQQFRLARLARSGCDALFSAGGNAPRGVSPIVTMCRNMLPFDPEEMARYGVSPTRIRILLLRYGQSRSFQRSNGVIFLSRYALDSVQKLVDLPDQVRIIPHGVEPRFRCEPRPQRELESCSEQDPFRILYVSKVDWYKHQWHVARAVHELRGEGLPLSFDVIGQRFPPAVRQLEKTLAELDPEGRNMRYRGEVGFEELHDHYRKADLFVFASSCENMPNILVEAMASGLPIACARRGPMPEVLSDGGLYFDPEDPSEIAESVRKLATDQRLRQKLAQRAFELAEQYSWERCARETFDFLHAALAAPDRSRIAQTGRTLSALNQQD